MRMIEIDGSMGEGGGQLLRTALALSMCTGRPIRLRSIRARRRQPGLRAQHLAAVNAAAAICAASVSGAALASRELEFVPGAVRPGRYDIDVGTAGSTLLVLQTILPPLARCAAPSEIVLRGGTHTPLAPSFEFVRDAWAPLLTRLGIDVGLELVCHGFMPRGGGQVRARIGARRPGGTLELLERGALRRWSARALLANLPEHIGQRELATLRARLGLPEEACRIEQVAAAGPGNAVLVELAHEHVTTVFTGFGMRGVPAETVAARTAEEIAAYVAAGVAVDRYLADQLLLPLALADGGRFSTLAPSGHTTTNAALIGRFLPVEYAARESTPGRWIVSMQGAASA